MLSAITLLHTQIHMDKCSLRVCILIDPSCIFSSIHAHLQFPCAHVYVPSLQTIPLHFLTLIQCH